MPAVPRACLKACLGLTRLVTSTRFSNKLRVMAANDCGLHLRGDRRRRSPLRSAAGRQAPIAWPACNAASAAACAGTPGGLAALDRGCAGQARIRRLPPQRQSIRYGRFQNVPVIPVTPRAFLPYVVVRMDPASSSTEEV